MTKNKWFTNPVFYIVMVVYFIVVYSALGYGDKWAAIFYPEDHLFENIQFITLLAAAGWMFYTAWLAYQNRQTLNINWIKILAYLALGLFFFFIAGEEVSWGQRIFNIATPESIAEVNAQQETNLHNLAIFEYSQYFSFDRLFSYFWASFAMLIPLISLFWGRFQQFVEKYLPIGYWVLGLLFPVNYVLTKVAKTIYGGIYSYSEIPFLQAIKQTKELNYYLLLFFLSVYFLWQLKQQIAAKSNQSSSPLK